METEQTKAQFVADVLNKTLYQLVIRCTPADGVRNYFDIGVIGYGDSIRSGFAGALGGKILHPLSDIEAKPLRIEERVKDPDKQVVDDDCFMRASRNFLLKSKLTGDFTMSNHLMIHVIDDDYIVRDSLNILLELEGYTVRTHASARSFLDMTEPTENGCILTDIQMPEMNGLELLATLNERGVCMPAIAMSGRADMEVKIEAKKRGAVDFLEKPFDPEILLEAVRAAIKNNSSSRFAKIETQPAMQVPPSLSDGTGELERDIELSGFSRLVDAAPTAFEQWISAFESQIASLKGELAAGR